MQQQNNWTKRLSAIASLSFIYLSSVHAMEIKDVPRQQLSGLRSLPKELQERLLLSKNDPSLRDVVTFLGNKPITLAHNNAYHIFSLKIIGEQLETKTHFYSADRSLKKRQKLWDLRTGEDLNMSKDLDMHLCDESLRKEIANDNIQVIITVPRDIHVYDTLAKEALFTTFGYPKGFIDMALDGNMVAMVHQCWPSMERDSLGEFKPFKKYYGIFTWTKDTGLQNRYIECLEPRAVALRDNIVAVGLVNGRAMVHNLETKQKIGEWPSGIADIIAIAVHKDMVVVGSDDGVARVFDITGNLQCILDGPHGHTQSLHLIDINDDAIVTASYDYTVKIWPLKIWEKDPETNPFAWIFHKSDELQLNFVCRASAAKRAEQEFIIDFPQRLGQMEQGETPEQLDGRVYFTFPEFVREYLRECLMIRRPKINSWDESIEANCPIM